MALEYNSNLVLRIIEYAFKNREISLNSIQRDLNLHSEEADYLRKYLINWQDETAPNHILTVPFNMSDGQIIPHGTLQLLPNAIFSYIDHLEIVEARNTAKEARRLSWMAIWISIITGVVSLAIGLFQLFIELNRQTF